MFVDIHNHILPMVDDGSPNMEFALDMARLAVAGGTEVMVATPHRAAWLRLDAPPHWVRGRVAELQEQIDSNAIALRIVPGVEIPVGPCVASELAGGKLLTIGDAGGWVLIEPPFDRIPTDCLDNLISVIDAGFRIVLAHPERNAVIQQHLAFVEACAGLGIHFQLTTGSILGRFGERAQRTAEEILRHAPDWQIVIASDAHDLVDRPPNLMAAARDAAAQIAGMDEANAMVDARPRGMIESSGA
jgi:protein-tyrosine phosphatase